MTSGDKRTTTPVEPECAVLMLCLSSLSKRKKLLEIKGAVAGPKGGFILLFDDEDNRRVQPASERKGKN